MSFDFNSLGLINNILVGFDKRFISEVRLSVYHKAVVKSLRGLSYVDYIPSRSEMNDLVSTFTNGCLYSCTDYIKRGFIPYKGCRIGVIGEVVTDNGNIVGFKSIDTLIIRIPHELLGCSDKIINLIDGKPLKSTVFQSLPGCGKTTMLRDIGRVLSQKYTVCVIDEKSEISGRFSIDDTICFDIGNCDILTSCTRRQSFEMIIRNYSPDVIITDEIYGDEDFSFVERALGCGIKVITSTHLMKIDRNIFDLYVKLGFPAGTVEYVSDDQGNKLI